MSSNEDEEKINSFIATGSELAGAALGGATGFIIGGLPGAVGGNVLGVALAKSANKLLSDLANRSLSKREQVRTAGTAVLAISKIQDYLKSGRVPRNDNFFEEQENHRSSAEEIFEGVLLKSKNEHEEKKAKIYANIFANVAFDSSISKSEANYIIQLASNLTYRQICVIALIERKNQTKFLKLRNDNYRTSMGQMPYETISLLLEIHPMYNLGLLVEKDDSSGNATYPIDWPGTVPDKLFLAGIGSRYYSVMGLQDIPEADIIEVGKYLSI